MDEYLLIKGIMSRSILKDQFFWQGYRLDSDLGTSVLRMSESDVQTVTGNGYVAVRVKKHYKDLILFRFTPVPTPCDDQPDPLLLEITGQRFTGTTSWFLLDPQTCLKAFVWNESRLYDASTVMRFMDQNGYSDVPHAFTPWGKLIIADTDVAAHLKLAFG